MFDYINETYGLNIKKGDRVRYTYGKEPKEGTIVGVHAGILSRWSGYYIWKYCQ